jgi:hypothetical protein
MVVMALVCLCCRQEFDRHPSVKGQQYCGNPVCQRARKNAWQREKLKMDKHYRENQVSAQKAWRERNPLYWESYRKRNPESAEKNRIKQHERNLRARNAMAMIAKMDVLDQPNIGLSRPSNLVLVDGQVIAKMDELFSKIRMGNRFPTSVGSGSADCKDG